MNTLEAEYQEKCSLLRQLARIQEECQSKARHYACNGKPELAQRFRLANISASNMRTHVGAALMAEREIQALEGKLR